MTQKQKCFVIDIDWDSPDGGYSILRSKRVVHYVLKNIKDGNNLIQTCRPFTTHKTKLYLKAKSFHTWQSPEWNNIGCIHVNKWIQSTPCKIGINQKMFIKYKSNEYVAGFAIYLLMIMTGEVTEKMHLEFVHTMQKTMTHCIIHNEEVDWFHIKQI
jgi:hypothetical protein